MTPSPRPLLIVASRNAGKLREIKPLLEPRGIVVRGVGEFPGVADVEETGTTFADNAALKAVAVAAALGAWSLGEDSGLMVDALGGQPGIFSARFAGTHGDDAANNARLLLELAGIPEERRGAQYVCSIAVADPAGRVVLTEEAACRGRIVDEARGANGFGYDPYFLVPEYHRTFGELSAVVKHSLSHRARALSRLLPRLLDALTATREPS